MSILIEYIVPFILILSVLVFVHEYGHFWVARRCGVFVETFSIGFGREVFGWYDRHGTRWRVSVLPLGGYVRMRGDADESSSPDDEALSHMSAAERATAFPTQPVLSRMAIVAAGPAANVLFAIVVMALTFMTIGQSYTPPVVGQVLENSPAAAAGLQPGDRFRSLDGEGVQRFEDLQRIVSLHPGETMPAEVERDGRILVLPLTPERIEQKDSFGNPQAFGRIGVARTGYESIRHDPFSAVVEAARQSWVLTGTIVDVVWQIIAGDRSANEIGGVARIAHMSGEVTQLGVAAVLHFMVLLSLNLALINLLPVPMLDGGHLLFFVIEALRGKPLPPSVRDAGLRIGFGLVIALMVFASWNDLVYFHVLDLLNV
ncbi:MAG: RIP metalloprotease RseP [Alphaproteobacteria bacterium]|nr:RIP metalloprotease RseP [Alphaproteobacteria bacterium]MCB9930071.1 RIP metalloprotease RseP [Alphaproteobacteria bacterium]